MKRLAFACWLAVLICIAWCAVSWRLGWVGRPHAGWAVAGLAILFLPPLVSTAYLGRRLVRREARLAGLAWLLASVTPLVWCGCYYAQLIVSAESRESLVITPAKRIAIAGALPYFDLEARLRYSRQTHGRYVTLFDNLTATDPERLVVEMDRHLEGMAGLLGQRLQPGRFGWVRGSLFGLTGRAVVCWGLCNQDDDGTAKLTGLDRHEMAHVLITVLAGPDQDPPAVLVEGWAEYQSADRNEQIIKLAHLFDEGVSYPLSELVKPEWYGRSSGPAYWEGGPLVHYLIERFGPEKFFELYEGVRLDTFHENTRRILDESWQETEEDFWQWVRTEAALLADESATPGTSVVDPLNLELSEGVDPGAWRELIISLREAHKDAGGPPQNLAVEYAFQRKAMTVVEGDDAGVEPTDEPFVWTVRAAFSGDSFWGLETFMSDETSVFMRTPDRSANLFRGKGGRVAGSVDSQSAESDASNRVAYLLKNRLRALPAFPWHASTPTEDKWRIDQIERPSIQNGRQWVVAYTQTTSGENATTYHTRERIDPASNWQVTATTIEQGGEISSEAKNEFRMLGGRVIPVRHDYHLTSEEETVDLIATTRLLSDDEESKLRNEVEAIANRGPTLTPRYATARRLIRLLAAGFPASVALLSFTVVWRSQTARPARQRSTSEA